MDPTISFVVTVPKVTVASFRIYYYEFITNTRDSKAALLQKAAGTLFVPFFQPIHKSVLKRTLEMYVLKKKKI